jgi:putative IMPACT (imprinted ancient) family translation regulator
VRAYGDAVGLALDEAGIRERTLRHTMQVRTTAADAGALDNRLRSLGVVTDVSYGEAVVFAVSVTDPDQFASELAGISGGNATAERIGTSWVDI